MTGIDRRGKHGNFPGIDFVARAAPSQVGADSARTPSASSRRGTLRPLTAGRAVEEGRAGGGERRSEGPKPSKPSKGEAEGFEALKSSKLSKPRRL